MKSLLLFQSFYVLWLKLQDILIRGPLERTFPQFMKENFAYQLWLKILLLSFVTSFSIRKKSFLIFNSTYRSKSLKIVTSISTHRLSLSLLSPFSKHFPTFSPTQMTQKLRNYPRRHVVKALSNKTTTVLRSRIIFRSSGSFSSNALINSRYRACNPSPVPPPWIMHRFSSHYAQKRAPSQCVW